MSLIARISEQFDESATLARTSVETLAGPIADAIERLVGALANDHKILACGNGASAGDAQHLAAALGGRFERERPELAAIGLAASPALLTAIADEYRFEDVFSRQVRALGQAGDVLVAISPTGNSPDVIAAIGAAHDRAMQVVALTGRGGGNVASLLGNEDVHLCVAHERVARIQEIHRLIIHCLCDGIDSALLGEQA